MQCMLNIQRHRAPNRTLHARPDTRPGTRRDSSHDACSSDKNTEHISVRVSQRKSVHAKTALKKLKGLLRNSRRRVGL